MSDSEDRTLRVLGPDSGDGLATPERHTGLGEDEDLVPHMWLVAGEDGAVSASTDGNLHVWELYTRGCLRTFTGHTGRVTAAKVLRKDRAVSSSIDGTLRVWDLTTEQCLSVYPCECSVTSLAVRSGAVPMVAVGLIDGQVQFFRLEEA